MGSVAGRAVLRGISNAERRRAVVQGMQVATGRLLDVPRGAVGLVSRSPGVAACDVPMEQGGHVLGETLLRLLPIAPG